MFKKILRIVTYFVDIIWYHWHKIVLILCAMLLFFNINLQYANLKANFLNSLDGSYLIELVERNHTIQMRFIRQIINDVNKLQEIQKLDSIPKATRKLNIDYIKQANVIFDGYITKDKGHIGSATHIKINNKSYILTTAHLLENIIKAIIITDNWEKYELEILKIDNKIDLALLKFKYPFIDFPYLEISEERPQEGDEVLVIGNPADYRDIITDGIIAKCLKKSYFLTNPVFDGSSGGAILYKRKVVGVITQLYTIGHKEELRSISYGIGINFKTLKEFLKEFENETKE